MEVAEVIDRLSYIATEENDSFVVEDIEAFKMAIKLLKQKPALDKIRAEIKEAIWEDVLVCFDETDEIRIPRLDPDDVFEIIDKYKAEQEPCDDVCEWFEQYVDIATDIVELRFSDGTVKRAKRGLYMRDIEKNIRKMLIDQIANEKKQEPKWIPVSEKLPMKGEAFDDRDVLVSCEDGMVRLGFCMGTDEVGEREWCIVGKKYSEPIAWMPLPQPYKAESEDK